MCLVFFRTHTVVVITHAVHTLYVVHACMYMYVHILNIVRATGRWSDNVEVSFKLLSGM